MLVLLRVAFTLLAAASTGLNAGEEDCSRELYVE